jgi:hypothetical protein
MSQYIRSQTAFNVHTLLNTYFSGVMCLVLLPQRLAVYICRSHGHLRVCLVQNEYSSPSITWPYDLWSAVCSHQQWSPLLHLPSVLQLHQKLISVILHCMFHVSSCKSPAAQWYALCYWQLLIVPRKDMEVLKAGRLHITQHNLHSVSTNRDSCSIYGV